jgi:sporulation-control protein spo0M
MTTPIDISPEAVENMLTRFQLRGGPVEQVVQELRLQLTAARQRLDNSEKHREQNREAAFKLQQSLTASEKRVATMGAKLLELAGDCAECAGTGTRMTTTGAIESEPCPDCEDIRELLK